MIPSRISFAAVSALLLLCAGCSSNAEENSTTPTSFVNDESEIGSDSPPFLSSGNYWIKKTQELIEIGKLSEANDALDNAKIDSSNIVEAEYFCTRTELLIRQGRLSEAEYQLEKCSAEAKAVRSGSKVKGYSMFVNGFFHQANGNFGKSIVFYEKALSHFVATNEGRNEAFYHALNNLGNVYYRIEKYDQARDIHIEALSGRLRLLPNNHPKIAASLGNLGNVYQAQGLPELALRYHTEAKRIWQSNGQDDSIQLSYSLNNIGLAQISLGEFSNAIENLTSAIDIKVLHQGHGGIGVASSLTHLADAQLRLGELDGSLKSVQSAVKIYESMSLQRLPKYAETRNVYARLLIAQESFEEALSIVDSELASTWVTGTTRSQILNTKSLLCLKLGDPECSLLASSASIDHNTGIRESGSSESMILLKDAAKPNLLLRSLDLKIASLIELARRNNSRQLLVRAFDTLDNLITLSTAYQLGLVSDVRPFKPLDNLDSSLESFVSIGIELLASEKNEEIERRIFIASDLYLGGSLMASFREVEDSLKEASDSIEDHNSLKQELLYDLGLPYDLYRRSSIGRNPDMAELFNRLHGFVSRDLREGVSVVEYIEVDDRLVAFILSNEGVDVISLGSADGISSNSDSLQIHLRKGEHNAFVNLASELHERLIDPILPIVGIDDLLVIPHHPVKGIPFELLLPKEDYRDPSLDEGGPIPYLITDRNISYGYSVAQILHSSKSESRTFEKEFLGLAPVFDFSLTFSDEATSFLTKHLGLKGNDTPYLAALPGSEKELTDISRIIDSNSSGFRKLTNNEVDLKFRHEVTESDLKDMDLTKYKYLHIATHGFADRERPSNSGIVLETNSRSDEDGILYANEVSSMKIGAELVVLSSCDSAFEKGPGTEIAGLAKSFIYAGSKSVVASLWPSDDVAAQILMRLFYVHMTSGIPADQALRQAKLDLLEMGGPIANPYYWAGFIHIGAPSGLQRSAA